MDINYLNSEELDFEIRSRGVQPGHNQEARRKQYRAMLKEIRAFPDKYKRKYFFDVGENLDSVRRSLHSLQPQACMLGTENPDSFLVKGFRTRLHYLSLRVAYLKPVSETERLELFQISNAVFDLEQCLSDLDKPESTEPEEAVCSQFVTTTGELAQSTPNKPQTVDSLLTEQFFEISEAPPTEKPSVIRDGSTLVTSTIISSTSSGDQYSPFQRDLVPPEIPIEEHIRPFEAEKPTIKPLVNLSNEPDCSIAIHSCASHPQASLPALTQKSMPVFKWNIRFSGNSGRGSVSSFLEKVEELRISRNVTSTELFNSASLLFTDVALLWYRSIKNQVSSWSQLVTLLKRDFLPPDYDHDLLLEIIARTQGVNENVMVYILSMEALFRKLSKPYPEEYILKQIIRNLNPYFSEKLSLCEVVSLDQLKDLCRKVQENKVRVDKYRPPPQKKSGLLEPEMACLAIQSDSSYPPRNARNPSGQRSLPMTRAPQGRLPAPPLGQLQCWNCSSYGHVAVSCPRPKTTFCYGCGRRGAIRTTCPNCNADVRQPKNEGAGSGRGAAAVFSQPRPYTSDTLADAVPENAHR